MRTRTLAQRIRRAITGSRKQQKALAAQLGVSEATLSQWASGVRTPRTDNLTALVAACGMEMEAFWRGASCT